MGHTDFSIDKQTLVVRTERLFDASPERLWQAYADPAQVPLWWGPRRLTTVVDQMDVRVGGKWRFVQRDADGQEFAFNGEYREIIEPTKLAYTFEFEGMPEPGHIIVETVTLEDQGGKTMMRATAQFANLADLEGMISSGMEEGDRESHDRLAELVETL
jgi:uncharacterized protein YndB with AHSA1/START domain